MHNMKTIVLKEFTSNPECSCHDSSNPGRQLIFMLAILSLSCKENLRSLMTQNQRTGKRRNQPSCTIKDGRGKQDKTHPDTVWSCSHRLILWQCCRSLNSLCLGDGDGILVPSVEFVRLPPNHDIYLIFLCSGIGNIVMDPENFIALETK